MNQPTEVPPFVIRQYTLRVAEIICLDPYIDASHRALGALLLLSSKFKRMVFTLPPHCQVDANVEKSLRDISKKVNLKIVRLFESQIPFATNFVQNFTSSEEAILNLKGTAVTEKIMEDFKDVTPFKGSALNILNMLSDPDIALTDIEKSIVDEPLLVVRVLQTANSSYFMRRNKVENVGNALAYLGQEGIKQILMSMIFQNLATKYFSQQQKKLDHSNICAHLAEKLVERKMRDRIKIGKIKVAATLHDLGALALQYCFPEEHERVVINAKMKNLTITEAEYQTFGITHCRIGRILCREWKLPDYVTYIAEHHHELPPEGEKREVMAPIFCANCFLNDEIDCIPTIEYKKMLAEYCENKEATEEEAIAEVRGFLKKAYESYNPSSESE